MEHSVMLYGGEFIPVSVVSDFEIFDPRDPNMLFFDTGRLKRFKKSGMAYIALFDLTKKFLGYYLEENFWHYNTILVKNQNTLSANSSVLGLQFLPSKRASSEAIVFFSYKSIDRDEDIFQLVINYGSKPINELNGESDIDNIGPLEDAILIPVFGSLNTYGNYVIDKEYLTPDGSLSPLNSDEKKVLFDVIYVLNEIVQDIALKDHLDEVGLYNLIQAHIDLPSRYAHANGEVDPPYHNLYNGEYFSLLRLKLVEFRYWILQYEGDYSKMDDNALVVYLVNIFPVIELSFLLYTIKISLLNNILKKNFWLIGNWRFNVLNEEQALLKIIRSIYSKINGVTNYDEIDKFMDLLSSPYESYLNLPLYQVLYIKLDDDLVLGDDGKGNLGQFINCVYDLWVESKFNTNHSNLTIAENALTKFNYTPYTASNSPDFPNEIDYSAAPLILGYESEKVLLWYKDNLDFTFYKGKIGVISDSETPVGYYHFFQPVALKATDNLDNIIKFPFKGISEVTSPSDYEYINNSIPAFFLQYVDYLGDYSDAKETVGAVLDVVLTFTGIGNVSKLKHYKYLSKLRKLSTLKPTEKIFVLEALSGAFGTIEITAGVSNIVLSYIEKDCEDPEFCKQLNYWLFALEVASLSGDLLAQRALRRSARQVVENVPITGWPPSFTNPADPLHEARYIIERVADIAALVDRFRADKLLSRTVLLDGFDKLPADKQRSFFYDFERQEDGVLDELNDRMELFNIWKSDEIVHLKVHKKNIRFLDGYLKITGNATLINHIHLGEGTLTRKRRPIASGGVEYNEANVSGYHNLDQIEDPPPGPGKICFKGDIANSNLENPELGYQQGTIERNMYDKIDDLTNKPWSKKSNTPPNQPLNPDHLKVKDYKRNVFWPSAYNTQRINEEMAFAYSNMNTIPEVTKVNQSGIVSNLYDGKATDGHVIQFQYYDGDFKTGDIKSIFPRRFK